MQFANFQAANAEPRNHPWAKLREAQAMAEGDGKYVWVKAEIHGNRVMLSAPGISEPVAIRYAWDVNPVCNLYNKSGLPAVPFRAHR